MEVDEVRYGKPKQAIGVYGVAEATGRDVDVFDVSQLLPGPFRTSAIAEAVAV